MITRRSYDFCISCKRLKKGQLKIYVQSYRLLKIIKKKLMEKLVYYLSNLFLQRKLKKKKFLNMGSVKKNLITNQMEDLR